MPSVAQIALVQEVGRAARSGWGSGATLSISAPSVSGRLPWLAMFERMCASPGMARASLEASFRIDVRPILPTITVPTLVIHAPPDPPLPLHSRRHLSHPTPLPHHLQ